MSKTADHPHFPSGEWEGFYTHTYGPDAVRFRMTFFLSFNNGKVDGQGSDNVGAFIWQGIYDTVEGTCNMVKQYIGAHQVIYSGHADENGIWGNWTIVSYGRGGFHIWPIKRGESAKEEALAEKKTLAKEKKKRLVKV
jgi:hypothetical protein